MSDIVRRIAVVGFGFSGLMVTANLIRRADASLTIYVIDPKLDGRGPAYGTHNPRHLLNVPAGRMGAWNDAPEDFVRWLESDEGKYAAVARKLPGGYGPADFAPRLLFGEYLAAIWRRAQEEAAAKRLTLRLVPAQAVRLAPNGPEALAVVTDRGDAIAVDHAVLATGNEHRSILPELHERFVVQNPWHEMALESAVASKGPIVLLGTGLTAVDMMLSLRYASYNGPLIGLSRRGLLPQPHASGLGSYAFDKDELFAQPSLVALLAYVRRAVVRHEAAGGDWREVVDALRSYTQRLWAKLSARDQRRFLRRLLPFWNVHRHRMAPQIDARLRKEIGEGKLRILAIRDLQAEMKDGQPRLDLTMLDGEKRTLSPSVIINCIGPEVRVPQSHQNLLKQLLADGIADMPENGVGLAVDPHLRLFGSAYPRLYAMGSLASGVLLESTAVPELRGQADTIARDIWAWT